MLIIDGVLQVVPQSISTDTGEMRVEDKTQSAIVQSFLTANGVVQVIIPTENVDGVIRALENAKLEADKAAGPAGRLEIAHSISDADKIAGATEKIKSGPE